jgi:hypothetical protein
MGHVPQYFREEIFVHTFSPIPSRDGNNQVVQANIGELYKKDCRLATFRYLVFVKTVKNIRFHKRWRIS